MQRNDEKYQAAISVALNKLRKYRESLNNRSDSAGKSKRELLDRILDSLTSDMSARKYLYLLRIVQENQDVIDSHKGSKSSNSQLRDICNELFTAYYPLYRESLDALKAKFTPCVDFNITTPINEKLIDDIGDNIRKIRDVNLADSQNQILQTELDRYECLQNILIGKIGEPISDTEIKNIKAYLNLLTSDETEKYSNEIDYTQNRSHDHLKKPVSTNKSIDMPTKKYGIREHNIAAASLLSEAIKLLKNNININDIASYDILKMNADNSISVKLDKNEIFRLHDKTIDNTDIANYYLDPLINLLKSHLDKIPNNSALLQNDLVKKIISLNETEGDKFDSCWDIPAPPTLSEYLDTQYSNLLNPEKSRLKQSIDQFDLKDKINGKTVSDLLGSKGTTILHADCKNNKSARELFIDALTEILNDSKSDFHSVKRTPNEDAINLVDLFGGGKKGKELLSLYEAAIKEESESKAFRDAVFLRATEHRKGDTWKNRLILWVAGPSASGKSVTKNKILDICSSKQEKSGKTDGNYITSIDGAIEREMSQIRQLTLQAALQKGYPGIADLDKHTKHGIKKRIQEAALLSPSINLIIPTTFSNFFTINTIEEYSKLPNVSHFFSEIVGSDKELFRQTVERNGNRRAWASSYGNPNDSPIRQLTINNRDIGCESKKYHGKHFNAGKSGSEVAAQEFHRHNQGNYIEVISDWIYVINDNGNWRYCTDQDKTNNIIGLTKRQFERWQKLDNKSQDLVEWLKTNEAKDKQLTDTIAEFSTPKQSEPSLAGIAASTVTGNISDALSDSPKILARKLANRSPKNPRRQNTNATAANQPPGKNSNDNYDHYSDIELPVGTRPEQKLEGFLSESNSGSFADLSTEKSTTNNVNLFIQAIENILDPNQPMDENVKYKINNFVSLLATNDVTPIIHHYRNMKDGKIQFLEKIELALKHDDSDNDDLQTKKESLRSGLNAMMNELYKIRDEEQSKIINETLSQQLAANINNPNLEINSDDTVDDDSKPLLNNAANNNSALRLDNTKTKSKARNLIDQLIAEDNSKNEDDVTQEKFDLIKNNSKLLKSIFKNPARHGLRQDDIFKMLKNNERTAQLIYTCLKNDNFGMPKYPNLLKMFFCDLETNPNSQGQKLLDFCRDYQKLSTNTDLDNSAKKTELTNSFSEEFRFILPSTTNPLITFLNIKNSFNEIKIHESAKTLAMTASKNANTKTATDKQNIPPTEQRTGTNIKKSTKPKSSSDVIAKKPTTEKQATLSKAQIETLSRYLSLSTYYAKAAKYSANKEEALQKIKANCSQIDEKFNTFLDEIKHIQLSNNNQDVITQIRTNLEEATMQPYTPDKIFYFSDKVTIIEPLSDIQSDEKGAPLDIDTRLDMAVAKHLSPENSYSPASLSDNSVQTTDAFKDKARLCETYIQAARVASVQRTRKGVYVSELHFDPRQVKNFKADDYLKWAVIEVNNFIRSPDFKGHVVIKGAYPPELLKQIVTCCAYYNLSYENRSNNFTPSRRDIAAFEKRLEKKNAFNTGLSPSTPRLMP